MVILRAGRAFVEDVLSPPPKRWICRIRRSFRKDCEGLCESHVGGLE